MTPRLWTRAEVLRYAADVVDLYVEERDGRGNCGERAKLLALAELDGALDFEERHAVDVDADIAALLLPSRSAT